MYRQSAPHEPKEKLPAELVCFGTERGLRTKISLRAMQGVSVGGVMGAALYATMGQIGPVVCMVVSAAAAMGMWRWQSQHLPEQVVLHVAHGRLEVRANGSKAWIVLDDLMDVILDTKTIQRLQDGAGAMAGVPFVDGKIGPEVETARVVLVARGQPRSVRLTEEYISHLDATEWFGKIRVFLRKHGWVPADERDLAPDSDAPSSA